MNGKHGKTSRIGGSVKVGSTGKISSLMNRELESSNCSPITPRRNPQSASVSISCSKCTFKLKTPTDEAKKTVIKTKNTRLSSQENIRPTRARNQARISVIGLATQNQQKPNGIEMEEPRVSRDIKIRESPDLQWKTRSQKVSHHIPMLGSEDKTIKRDKKGWKVNLVEVVDTNCGIPAGSLSTRLKKLSFAKLSQSII